MAIADTITSMQNHTSNAYTMIGYGTDLTGINKNLENLSTSIFNAFLEALRTPDTLFTNLPKKSGTGANITLNDTANAPMRITLGSTELSQASTPTPSSPQDIHTISGSNTIRVFGKNIWNEQWENGYWNRTTGTKGSGSNYLRCADYQPITPNTTIYFNKPSEFINYAVIFYDSTKTIINPATTYTASTYFIAPANAYYFTFYGDIGSGTATYHNNIMINLGNTATTYEPYTSQEADVDLGDLEYCKIGNYEDKFIRNSGKQLLDLKDGTYTATDITAVVNNGEIILNGTASATRYVNIPLNTNLSFVNGEKYTTSANNTTADSNVSLRYDAYGQYDTALNSANKYRTITYSTDYPDYVSYVVIRIQSGASLSNFKFRPMLNKGTTALDYEPYGSNEWYIKKNNIKINIKDITISNFSTTYNRIDGRIMETAGSETNINGLCNVAILKTNISVNSNQTNTIVVREATDRRNFYLWLDGITTLEQAQTYIANTSDYIICQMSIPTYTQITRTLAEQLEYVYKNMLSQKGQTNISQVNNDLPFNMSVLAIEEL